MPQYFACVNTPVVSASSLLMVAKLLSNDLTDSYVNINKLIILFWDLITVMVCLFYLLVDFGVSAQLDKTIGRRNTFIGTPYWSVYLFILISFRVSWLCQPILFSHADGGYHSLSNVSSFHHYHLAGIPSPLCGNGYQ